MIGIIVEFLISCLLLRFMAKTNLSPLGLMPTRRRLIDLVWGVLWPVAFFAAFQYVVSLLVQNPYRVNPYYTWPRFWASVLYLSKSVIYENLIFNAALLYLLIKYAGPKKALWISAAAFGMYHWFSWQLFDNPAQMLLVLLITGSGAYMFALAYEKTRSVYLPFALHFGVDFSAMILFSLDKNMGHQFLIKTFPRDPVSPGSVISIMVIAVNFLWFPLLTWLLLRKMKPIAAYEENTMRQD